MLGVVIILLIIWASMWGFYKFMYPRPPKSMMPQKGDVTTPRQCDFCGNHLAEYRGVLETKPNASATADGDVPQDQTLFFCNYEHQADFHEGKRYS